MPSPGQADNAAGPVDDSVPLMVRPPPRARESEHMYRKACLQIVLWPALACSHECVLAVNMWQCGCGIRYVLIVSSCSMPRSPSRCRTSHANFDVRRPCLKQRRSVHYTSMANDEEEAHVERRAVMNSLAGFRTPLLFCALVFAFLNTDMDMPTSRIWDHVEYFAGRREVTNALRRSDGLAIAYERDDDPIGMDLCSDVGFLHAVHCPLRVRPGGGVLLAPVCSSWVFVNRGTSLRSEGRSR